MASSLSGFGTLRSFHKAAHIAKVSVSERGRELSDTPSFESRTHHLALQMCIKHFG